MATQTDALEAEVREETGKSANRKLRGDDRIPAVVYGREVTSRPLAVHQGDIEPLLKDGALNNRLLQLEVEGEEESRSVLIKDIDLDPVTDGLLHVDFHQVRAADTVRVEVPLKLTGESPGVELEGGIVDQPVRALSVECEVRNIPEELEVSVDEMEVGDAVFVSDVEAPANAELLDDPDRAIVTIQPPEEYDLETTTAEETELIEETVEEAMEEVAEAEEEPTEEGEVEAAGEETREETGDAQARE